MGLGSVRGATTSHHPRCLDLNGLAFMAYDERKRLAKESCTKNSEAAEQKIFLSNLSQLPQGRGGILGPAPSEALMVDRGEEA